MSQRVALYTRSQISQTERLPATLVDLRQAVEARGDVVVDTFVDDVRIGGRGKNAGWNALVTKLDAVDQVVVATAGDLPGRRVSDLLKLLATLRECGSVLIVNDLRTDSGSDSFALLDLVEAYRAAKLSGAIRMGQARARLAGKRIGRPVIPLAVRTGVQAYLTSGGGIRLTARRFNVSPASVINIRRMMIDGSQPRQSE